MAEGEMDNMLVYQRKRGKRLIGTSVGIERKEPEIKQTLISHVEKERTRESHECGRNWINEKSLVVSVRIRGKT